MQTIYQGRTNNHVNWVMVDATDFATPESALSAATKIKIWGQLRSATGTNFITSGTGSLTNDITHVGASATGQYHIALAKADISDASAAFYDTYIINLSATGAAYQTLILEGKRDDNSYVSNVLSYLSNIASYLSNMESNASGIMSDTYSLLSDHHSDFQSRVPKRVATDSQLSDLASDLRSYLVVMSGVQSDVYSLLSDHHSDFQSRVPKRVATDSQLSDMASDIKSAIAGITATVGASDISDIASAVKAILASDMSDILSAAVQTNSRALVIQSFASDIRSHVSDLQSDFQSRVPKRVATDSQLSDMASDLKSYLTTMSGVQSDVYSLLSDLQSDFQSRVPKAVATNSQLSDLASDLASDLKSFIGAGVTLTAGERTAVADALISRNVAGGSSAGRTVKQALAALRNKQEIAAGTLTVYDTDDTTALWDAVVTTAAGNPLASVDPA